MNPGQIQTAPILPLGLILLILALGMILSYMQFRFLRRRLTGRRAGIITLLRAGVIFLLALVALNPYRVEKNGIKLVPALAILIDASPTMALKSDVAEGSRLEEAKALLTGGSNSLLKTLSGKYEIHLYALQEFLKDVPAGEIVTLKPGRMKGKFDEVLETLSGENRLALLFSDGNLQWENRKSGGFPVIPVAIGRPDEYRDILIKTVKAPALAFRGKEVVIDATVKGYGYPGLTVPVVLKSGEKLLAAQNVRLPENSGEGNVSLSFTPEEVGNYTLSLSVPLQIGESLAANNRREMGIKVHRDKIRVLMVSGTPSMNYRFLRTALKNDPIIDLLSFVILRTPSNILNVPVQEQSLIPFPVDTLFTKELKNFDLLIFDNFLYQPFFPTRYLENIKEFVREGGAFAFIGGANFLGEGGYARTPLDEILPTRWIGKESYRRASPLYVRASRAGMNHPITRFSPADGDPIRLWREMPPLDGFNPLESKSAGTVILEGAEGGIWPILTVGSYGKGRVLVLATDYSWKWYTGMAAKERSPDAYLGLIERMVRWLTRAPGLEALQIALPEKKGAVGEEVEFRVKGGRDEIRGRSDTVSLTVLNPAGLKIASQLKATEPGAGQLGTFVPEKAGTYKIKVENKQGVAEEPLLIPNPEEEFDGAPNHGLLKSIASSTGGKILYSQENLLREIEDLSREKEGRIEVEKTIPLWANPFLLSLIIALLTGEWYLRRRWGLI